MSDTSHAASPIPQLKGGALKADLISGFLVFLIALPLCLGIAKASGYPSVAGIWTAVIGGIICTFISNSQMTIKGPAAGLIVIVLGAVNEYSAEINRPDVVAYEKEHNLKLDAKKKEDKSVLDEISKKNDTAGRAYRLALGVGVVAGVIQILFGLLRAGVLADLFPISAVHGLLASIGVIIMFKQAYAMIGLTAPGDEAINSVIGLPAAIPDMITNIALIGIPSLIILFALPFIKHPIVKKVPGPVFVLLFAIPMGYVFGLEGNDYLVRQVDVLGDPGSAFARPNFEGVATSIGIKYVILFALIGSLESLLSAKAVDLLDPQKRKTDLNRDLLAVGVANTVASAVGGLPMISEIVRSSANINNGARSKFADLFHSLFLLLAVVFLAAAIHRIPLAALGAMLVFTGYRLAHPREFMKALKIGPEQLLIFVTTIVVVLFTDLLIGIAAGVAVKLLTLLFWKIYPASWFRLDSSAEVRPDGTHVLHVSGPIVFLNWVRVRARLANIQSNDAVLNVSKVTFVDHTSIEKLHELEMDYKNRGGRLEVEGMDNLVPVSSHNLASRRMKKG